MVDLTDCTILIVDDVITNIDILVNGLADEPYDIAVAVDGANALELVPSLLPELILLDIVMPCMSGYEVCKILKADKKTKNIPIIFLTALDQTTNKSLGFEAGAIDYITKPFDILEVKSRIKTHLELGLSQKMLTKQNEMLDQRIKERTQELTDANKKLKRVQIEVIMRLGLATEMRDDATGSHVQRIREMVELIANKFGIDKDKSKEWGLASTMHDVGKVGISDQVLLKPGRLTPEEFEIIKTHTTIGAKILDNSDSDLIQIAQMIALNHHEKWNGSGYPQGLHHDEIPLPARITTIADVFDALISPRPYKEAWKIEDIIKYFKEESGNHFDPELTELLLLIIPDIIKLREEIFAKGAQSYFYSSIND